MDSETTKLNDEEAARTKETATETELNIPAGKRDTLNCSSTLAMNTRSGRGEEEVCDDDSSAAQSLRKEMLPAARGRKRRSDGESCCESESEGDCESEEGKNGCNVSHSACMYPYVVTINTACMVQICSIILIVCKVG